jgi:hypothetical protein
MQKEGKRKSSMDIHINYDLYTLSEYMQVYRNSKYLAKRIQQGDTNLLVLSSSEKYTGAYPITVTIRPHYTKDNYDLTNFRAYGLLQALVDAGIICAKDISAVDNVIISPVFDKTKGVDIKLEPTNNGYNASTIDCTMLEFVNSLTLEQRTKAKKYLERWDNGAKEKKTSKRN